MTILDEIVAYKIKEVEERKLLYPTKLLERSMYFETETVSLKQYILRDDLSRIIAEFKRKSPSKGIINDIDTVDRVSVWYMQAGASALSILTDEKFFGGTNQDLITARKYNYCPILRKDFVIDEYQLVEAKSIGADAVLLIAEVLEKDKLFELAKEAKKLGLEVLMEIHHEKQLEKVNQYVDLVGVNNRDLSTFNVDINNSMRIIKQIPNEFVKISESGISTAEDVVLLKQVGFNGFLIGEKFMKSDRPGKACENFIKRIKSIENE